MSLPSHPSEPVEIELPCGRTADRSTFDMGMREYTCPCGATHAVIMDVHPLGRWIPESVGDVLRATVEPTDEYDEFSTIHLMGMILEEYPEAIAIDDASEDPAVGYALLWITEFDARELHRIVVELLVELMDHAVSHIEDDVVRADFDAQLSDFDVEAFVDEYRAQRDFSDPRDRPPK